MGKYRRVLAFILALLLTLLTVIPAMISRDSSLSAFFSKQNFEEKSNPDKYEEWIIKWEGPAYDTDLMKEAEILDWLPEQHVMRVKMTNKELRHKWLEEVRKNPEVIYIQPNHQYSIHQAPNDTYYEKQDYLKQIKAEAAWDVVSSTDLTIAVLDTGVDLFHVDLKDHLVEGYNLLDKEKLPLDDNGHGTNVAGIVAAATNNSSGIAGIAWNAKIMPIKVLEKNGEGKDFFIGQGIRYAVNHGAKVIVLSLGEFAYTPFMKEAIDYAETKGALIIAATGNDGDRLKFPSAFSNVLSVGAVDRHDIYEPYSNYGQQLDVVAPDEGIYTTKLGGGYEENSGTSMAAPQVAGLATLIFQKYPDMTPQEVRDLIKFTADDVGKPGWDERTGYGRINMERALTAPRQILIDGYESNQYSYTAHQFPLGDTFYAQLNAIDMDWYKLTIPYKGKVNLNVRLNQLLEHGISLEIYTEEQLPDTLPPVIEENENQEEQNDQEEQEEQEEQQEQEDLITETDNETTPEEDTELEADPVEDEELDNETEGPENYLVSYQIRKEETISLDLEKGDYYIKARLLPNQNALEANVVNYQISNSFAIYKDEYEDNDKPWQAYRIAKPDVELTGTIHKDNDVDWYRISSNSDGMLTINVAVDTLRLDPVILFQPPDGQNKVFDYQGAGEEEFATVMISKGDYLIRISDYNNFGVDGEYKLKLRFRTTDNDENEPNDESGQSVILDLTDRRVSGIIADSLDYDWFHFIIEEKTYVSFDFVAKREAEIVIYNDKLEALNKENNSSISDSYIIDEGKYYLRMSSDNLSNNYSFKLLGKLLDGNFTDIHYHWARDSIVYIYERNIMSGFNDYTFKPDQPLTREEAAIVFYKYFGLTSQGDVNFTDIDEEAENVKAIRATVNAGILEGFSDGTFRPNEGITRQEVIVALSKAFYGPEVELKDLLERSLLEDVKLDNKAYKEIYTFLEKGWLEDFIVNNKFSPKKPMTRAEFAVIIKRMIQYTEE